MTDTTAAPGDRLRAALAAANGANPDQVAQAQRRAAQVGAPRSALDGVPQAQWPAAPDEFDVEAFLAEYPRTASYLEEPANARVAGRDGRESLSLIERSIYTGGDVSRRALEGVGTALGTMIRGVGRAGARTFDNTRAEPFFEDVVEVGTTVQRGARNVGGTSPAAERATLRTPLPAAQVDTGFGGEVASGLGQLAAQAMVLIGTGGAGGTALLGAQGVGAMDERVEQARVREGRVGAEYTVQEDLALLGGGAVTALSERLGLEAVLRGLPKPVRDRIHNRLGEVIAAGLTEGLTEVVETVGQNGLAIYLLGEDSNLLDGAVEAGSVGTVVGSLANAIVQSATPGRQNRVQAVDQDNATVRTLAEQAAASPLRERSPEAFEDALAQIADGGPVTDLYISAEALNQSGVDIPALRAAVPSIDQQLDAATETGGDIRIPVGEFGARIAGTDFVEPLLDHMRANPVLPSLAEQRAAGEDAAVEAEVEGVLRAALDQDAFAQSQQRVEQGLFQELENAKRFTADVNRPYAALVSNFYAATARRLGITPEQAAERYQLRVQAELPQAQREATLDQPAETPSPVVRLIHFSPTEGLVESDPLAWGRNAVATTRAERSRTPIRPEDQPWRTPAEIAELNAQRGPPRTYFYREGVRPETPIQRTSPIAYESEIAADALYDFDNDPLKLRPAAGDPTVQANLYEQAIRAAGFQGYFSDTRGVRGAVAVFDPLPLRPASLYAPVEGAPKSTLVNGERVQIKPFAPAREAAANYMASRGLQYEPPTSYAPVDVQRAGRLAGAFDQMAHAPNDPLVRAAYSAMIEETLAQYQFVKATGLEVEFIEGDDPYAASPRLAIQDVVENNHLWVFPTDAGFGGTESLDVDISGNPLLGLVDEWIGDRQLRANDVFRIVHDYFGHIKDGFGFRADGEENAWQSHAAMYSPLARRAMTTETRGQNSWVNFGPFADFNKTANAAETEYAPQKVGLLPEWASTDGFLGGANSGLPEGEQALYQTANVRRGEETLEKYGLEPGKKYKTREVAAALEARQRKKYGTIPAGDRSDKAANRIAGWMAEEIKFELENEGSSGVGWYSTKFQAALDIFAQEFPELKTDAAARDVMTALIAITSDGQKVVPNFQQAAGIYRNFKRDGRFTASQGTMRQDSVDGNLAKVQELYDTHGPERMRELLLEEMTVSDLKKKAADLGVPFSASYPAATKMPLSAVVFGPKLGAFYANLMGAEGYLTMDRWWSRTFNRYRGTLLQAPTRQGIARVRELLGDPSLSDDQVLAATVEPRNRYAAKGFKNGTELEKAANTVYKAAFENLEDQPFNAGDRGFMLATVNKAKARLAKEGIDISVADIQAVLWYYEKRLYGELGARQTADISYEEAAQRVVSEGGSVGSERSDLPDAVAFESTDPGEDVFDADAETERTLFQSDVEPNAPFYSALTRAVADSQTKSAPAAQWLATLRKTPGVKAEELEWSGLEDWLGLMGSGDEVALALAAAEGRVPDAKGNIKREDVLAFLQNGGVKVEEVVLGEADIPFMESRILNYMQDNGGDYEQARREIIEEAGGQPAQFSEYFLKGMVEGSHREILLTLPNIAGPSTHWDAPNVVAHMRVAQAELPAGEPKTLVLGENQSDWHQKGEDEGYEGAATPEEKAAARAAHDDAYDAREAALANVSVAVRELVARRIDELEAVLPEAEAAGGTVAESINGMLNLLTEAEQQLGRGIDPYRILNQGSLALVRTPEIEAASEGFSQVQLRLREAQIALDALEGGIPNAPFRKSWATLVMKRVIRYAVDNGFARIVWINGNQQNGGRTGGDSAWFYERNLVNATNDLLKKMGGRVEAIDMMSEVQRARVARIDERAKKMEGATGLVASLARADAAERREILRPDQELGIQNGFTITDQMRAQARQGFPLFQQNRGQIAFGQDITQSPSTISLLRTADLSTFLHETGHFFEAVTLDIASRPDAPAEIVEDAETMLAWMGVEGDRRAPATLNIGQNIGWSPDGDTSTREPLSREEVDAALAEAGLTATSVNFRQSDTEMTYVVELAERADAEVLAALSEKLGQQAIAQQYQDGTGILAGPVKWGDGNFDPQYFLRPDGSPATAHKSAIDVWKTLPFEQKRPMRERFAKGFEAYLMEGKAPTPALRELFQRFRSWLLNVYKSLTALNVELTDDVRGVMGRMVAADDEIKATEAGRGFTPLAEKPPYMDDATWSEYQQSFSEATEQGVDTLTTRAVRDMRWLSGARSRALKRLQAQARDQRKAVKAEVTAEVMAEPVNRARQYLRRGTDENGEPIPGAGKLDLATLKEMYGDAPTAPWRKLKIGGKYGEARAEGVHPDVVAELFGYDSGDALVRDLASAEDANEKIAGMTDQRMLERYGDLSDPQSIERAADEAVANDAHSRAIATDYAALAQATGQPRALVSQAKAYAASVVSRMELRQLKPNQFFAAMTRAGKAADKAPKAGGLVAAATARRNQLVNLQAAKAVLEAKAEAEKALTFFKRITSGKDDALSRSRDMALVNAARAVLAAYGIGRVRNDPASYLERVKSYDPQLYADIQPFVEGARGAAKPFDQITVEQMKGLRDTVNQLWVLSRRTRQIELDGRLVDINTARDELGARLDEIGYPRQVGQDQAPTDGDRFHRYLQGERAALRRVESWARAVDAGDRGPFRTYIWNPVSTAADRYRVDQARYLQRFRDIVKPIGATLTRAKIAAPEIGYTFTGKAELLGAILHTGNGSNMSKLLLGRRWGSQNADGTLDTSRWDAMLQRMWAENILTKADYDFAQATWDLLEETKPAAQNAHRAMYGRYFSEIMADPIQTPFGEYRGGYVPATPDSFLVQDAQLREEQNALEDSNAFMFPAASNGFTKARVEDYTRALSLDIGLLPLHIDKVLKFTHLGPPVRDVARVLRGQAFAAKLAAFDPVAASVLLLPWLQRSARQVVQEPSKGQAGKLVDGFFRELRSRTGMQLMFANLSNVLQQVTGLSNAMVRVKPSRVAGGLWSYLRDPKGLAEAVTELSPFMASRTSGQVFEMRQTIEQLLLNPTKYEKLRDFSQRHAYFFQFAAQNVTDLAVWKGAYEQAIERGDEEREAVRFADSVIRETQSSMAAEDVSRFETGTAFARLFTQFYSYFNNQANLLGTEGTVIQRQVGLRNGAGRLLYLYVVGFAVPALLADAIATAMRGGFEDDEEDGYLDELLAWFFGAQAKFGVAGVPVVGQIANAAIGGFTPAVYDDRISASPAISVVESSARLPGAIYESIVEGEALKRRDVRDLFNLLGLITGTPLGAVGRPVSYGYAVAQGEVEPTSAADAARGLVTGTPSPESRTQ